MASPEYLLLLLCCFFPLLSKATGAFKYSSRARKYTPFDERCDGLPQHVRNGTAVTVVDLKTIAGALRENGNYEVMAMIVERDLRSNTFPFCGRDMAFFVDRRHRITLFGQNAGITIFVPSDDSFFFEECADLGYQVAMAEIDEQAFEDAVFSEGSKFDTASYRRPRLVVDRVFDNGTVSINQVKITEWNIYSDGRVRVHGTEDFFRFTRGAEVPKITYDEYGAYRDQKWNYFAMYKEEESGPYLTKKMFMDPDRLLFWDHDVQVKPLSSIQELL